MATAPDAMTTSTGAMTMHTGATGAAMRGMVVPNAELTATTGGHLGSIVSDKDHLALYAFSADGSGRSSCYGACATAWPPLLVHGSPRVVGLNSALLGTTLRTDGTRQITYGGHPLYYWSGDMPGTVQCQAVKLHGGYWYALHVNGTLNTTKVANAMSMAG